MAKTLGSVMDEHNGAGPGFDFLRLFLSIAIVLLHCWKITIGDNELWTDQWFRPLSLCLLPMFFGLSGFLVSGSSLRTRSLPTFLSYRILRIIPALTVEVVLSALVLGPLVTKLLLPDYFSDPLVWAYFGNIVGNIHFYLPGVFVDNPFTMVNSNLWTLKPEFICYLSLAAVMFVGVFYKRGPYTLLTLVILALYNVYMVYTGYRPDTFYSGHLLVCAFLIGSLFYHWRYYVPCGPIVIVALMIVSYFCMMRDEFAMVSIALLTYLCAALGMVRFPHIPLLQSGDYSYGIYLYGSPIQQTVVFLWPTLTSPFVLFVVSAPLIAVFAAFSWHCIEKHALRLKRYARFGRTAQPSPA